MGGPIALAVAEACTAPGAHPRARCVLYSEPNIDGGDCFGSRPGSRLGTDLASLDARRAAKVATCRHLVADSDSGELLGRMQAVRTGGTALPSMVLIGEKQIRGSGGSLDPPVPFPMHLHTAVYMVYSECRSTRLTPLAERMCFSQVLIGDQNHGRLTSEAALLEV